MILHRQQQAQRSSFGVYRAVKSRAGPLAPLAPTPSSSPYPLDAQYSCKNVSAPSAACLCNRSFLFRSFLASMAKVTIVCTASPIPSPSKADTSTCCNPFFMHQRITMSRSGKLPSSDLMILFRYELSVVQLASVSPYDNELCFRPVSARDLVLGELLTVYSYR